MPTPSRSPFLTIHAEGALLPVDLLQRVVGGDKDLDGLSPDSYHLSGKKLNEAINSSWNTLIGAWAAFQSAAEKLPEGDPGTSITREKWLLPLFQELGYGRLVIAHAVEIEGKSYAVSHGWNEVPIHLVGLHADVDHRTPGVVGAAKASPHSLLQELLNRSPERLWGFVSNGLRMRLLRDNASLTRQAYLEFDMEAMMDGEVYADFVVLWLVCHQSRVESRDQRVENCWLEVWSKAAQERGTRALDGLRVGVEKAIQALGRGFIGHPANTEVRGTLRSGALATQDLYRQLLRMVYRLIFLFVAEDRQLLYDPASDIESRNRYARFYSTARLRRMAERVRGGRHADLYVALKLVMDKLGNGGAPELGLPALGGFLFSRSAMSALADCELSNTDLLEAVRSLAFTQDGRIRRAVDYRNLGSEELGSIYESLLELHPLVNTDAATFELTSVSGSERKTTGSYYTPTSLIQVLLDSALDPVIEQAVRGAGSSSANQQTAILNLKICDPACGSGHFLVAAAHRLARRLAAIQSSEGEPAPEAMRSALRVVISNCIYGVDINPMSVELCKVSLWMEALDPGKPLSFLDAHIQCGDSLVGVSPNLDISRIPDEAFNPTFGDDRATASALKKRNKRERGGDNPQGYGQLGFRVNEDKAMYGDDLIDRLVRRAAQVDAMPEDDSEQVQAKAKAFGDYHSTREYLNNRLELDLWTAAFFWSIRKGDAESMLAPTQQELIQLRNGGEPDARLMEKVHELADRLKFLHWELTFPKIFSGENAGFDCVLGNPPWERIKLQEEEFFAQRDPEIATAANKAVRKKMIDTLAESNPALAHAFEDAKNTIDCVSKFVRASGRFPLTAVGDVNTYALFAELNRSLIARQSRAGMIVPTGISTDETTREFFGSLTSSGTLVSLFDFENREGLFPAVHRGMKFCILVVGTERVSQPVFVFFATRVQHLKDTRRVFSLPSSEIAIFNPNTRTMPIFRTKADAEMTRKIYAHCPILIDDETKYNPWKLRIITMFHMANDSGFFRTRVQLEEEGFTFDRNVFRKSEEKFLPLYEGKMFQQFDHRAASVVVHSKNIDRQGQPVPTTLEQYADVSYLPSPQYWVSTEDINNKYPPDANHKHYLAFKGVTAATNERTMIATIIPFSAIHHNAPILIINDHSIQLISCFLANLNSIVFDYVTRQKTGNTFLMNYVVKQLPALPPSVYSSSDIDFLIPRVLELVYNAYDLRAFAEDMGYHGEPFRWDEVRRAQLRAELDAYYAKLYGLTRDELRYVLDPQEVYGDDFPGETFRVLKEKEIKQFGEYRTRRLVLEAWDGLAS